MTGCRSLLCFPLKTDCIHPLADFKLPIRVYYEDTDAGGVVYHANYLNYMERCRCEWLLALGFDVAQLQQSHDTMFVVRDVELHYLEPARLFDHLTVSCHPLQVGKVKLVVQQNIYNQARLLCSATFRLATLSAKSFKLTAMPVALKVALERDLHS